MYVYFCTLHGWMNKCWMRWLWMWEWYRWWWNLWSVVDMIWRDYDYDFVVSFILFMYIYMYYVVPYFSFFQLFFFSFSTHLSFRKMRKSIKHEFSHFHPFKVKTNLHYLYVHICVQKSPFNLALNIFHFATFLIIWVQLSGLIQLLFVHLNELQMSTHLVCVFRYDFLHQSHPFASPHRYQSEDSLIFCSFMLKLPQL